MKYGVLNFSYSNFQALENLYAKNGFYTINLGDYMQTLAIRNLYRLIGIQESETLTVDRDSLATYRGEDAIILMNGCFYTWCFPLPDNITPVFIGFQAREPVIIEFIDLFKKYEPIGCRDLLTAQIFEKHGVSAFTTGCVTLTLNEVDTKPRNGRVLLVHGTGPGEFPLEALQHMPSSLLSVCDLVFQRKVVHDFPLRASDMSNAELYARHLLNDFRSRASLVVTPLHHAAAPCMASGIPVVLCRKKDDTRFSYLKQLTPLYLPGDYANIDWAPKPVSIAPIRAKIIEQARIALETALKRGPR